MKKALIFFALPLFIIDNYLNAICGNEYIRQTVSINNETPFEFDVTATHTADNGCEGDSIRINEGKVGSCGKLTPYSLLTRQAWTCHDTHTADVKISYNTDLHLNLVATQCPESLALDGTGISEPITRKVTSGAWTAYWTLPDPKDPSKNVDVLVECTHDTTFSDTGWSPAQVGSTITITFKIENKNP